MPSELEKKFALSSSETVYEKRTKVNVVFENGIDYVVEKNQSYKVLNPDLSMTKKL